MKSGPAESFYASGPDRPEVLSTPATAGPWSTSAQHGGPPSGLLARALQAELEPEQVLGRISVDLLGPVPVGPLSVTTSVVRAGRSVSLLSASLRDVTADRECAVARAWVLPRTSGPGATEPLPHKPDDGLPGSLPRTWSPGYIDHIEWRFIAGSVARPGPATVWMRPTVPLFVGEELGGVPLLMTCIDSASGMSSVLDIARWSFLNTELTVHVLREPVGSWICVDAETTLVGTGVGVCTASAYDTEGLVARSAQTLMIAPARR